MSFARVSRFLYNLYKVNFGFGGRVFFKKNDIGGDMSKDRIN